jgi:hypothetical protein
MDAISRRFSSAGSAARAILRRSASCAAAHLAPQRILRRSASCAESLTAACFRWLRRVGRARGLRHSSNGA